MTDITNLIRDRIDTVEKSSNETRDLLASHVTECAAIQKRVLVLSACILTWEITHSPEAIALTMRVFNLLKTFGLL